jgi:acetolactate synthase I/II/III large subunit
VAVGVARRPGEQVIMNESGAVVQQLSTQPTLEAAASLPRADLWSGGEAVVRSLERQGVRHVFGIPGDHTIPIYAALGNSTIEHCTVRHEQGAGFMADGYARASGEPGVAIVIGGPGLTNIGTALAEAYADGVPVLVISAETPLADFQAGRDHNHELRDQRAAAAALCDWSERVSSVDQIPVVIDRAFAGFRSGRPRSVHIGVPIDVLAQTTPPASLPAFPAPRPTPDLAAVRQAGQLLRQARNPLLLLGGGARFAQVSAERLASRLDAPVMTTWSGKDAFPCEHPLWVGEGLHLTAATDALASADVVLAIGTQLGWSDFWQTPDHVSGKVIRVDIDPEQLSMNAEPKIGIVGDARPAMDAITEEIANRTPQHGVARARTLRDAIDAEVDQAGRLYRPWLEAMRRGLPAETVIAADSTLATYLGFRYLPIPTGGAWIYPNAYGTLGYALPAAIGARVAQSERPAAVLIGDGGLLFTCPELLTATERGMGLPVVVWNDRGFGCIREGMLERRVRPLGVDFVIPDISALARAFGGAYSHPDRPETLETAVRAALERDVPTVIEIAAHHLPS